VEGLAELQRELKRLGRKGALDDMKAANHKVGQMVADRAADKAASIGGSTAKVGETLRSAKQQRAAVVTAGKASVPFPYGAEFGAKQDTLRQLPSGPRLGWNQFSPWRGSGSDAGYFLWPTIRESNREIKEFYAELVMDLTSAAFPD